MQVETERMDLYGMDRDPGGAEVGFTALKQLSIYVLSRAIRQVTVVVAEEFLPENLP